MFDSIPRSSWMSKVSAEWNIGKGMLSLQAGVNDLLVMVFISLPKK